MKQFIWHNQTIMKANETSNSTLNYLQKQHPGALTLDELATALPDLSKRMIQHRLAQAVLSGVITKTGKARATRYQWIKAVSAKNKLSKNKLSKDDPIIWSPESLLRGLHTQSNFLFA
jgi:hypothetical protein